MVDLAPPPDASLVDWTRWAKLNSGLPTEGPEQIARIDPVRAFHAPDRLTAFDRHLQVQAKASAMLHFYTSDIKLRRVLNNPGRYVARFADFGGIISPDFSLYRSMPPHERIRSVWASRAAGAYYQQHGLLVVPHVRWAVPEDYDFCFLGLPARSVLAVSTHGCCRDRADRHYFRHGLLQMMNRLDPTVIVVHGPMPPDIFDGLPLTTELLRFPSDSELAHVKAA